MLYYKVLYEDLEKEIDGLVEAEAKRQTWEGQQRLHVLLENCKHLREAMAMEKAAHGVAKV